MSLTTPFPEPDSPDLERFAIYSRSEVVSLLRQLRDRHVLVTVYFDQTAGFAVSNVLDVNAGFEEMTLDCASDPAAQTSIYASIQLVVVAFLDNVKIQFTVGAAEPFRFEGRPAFRVRLPQQLLRMQRRSFSRRQPPASQPAACLVPSPTASGQYESVRVLDLSAGGLAMLAHPQHFELPMDRNIEHCYLDLPGIGQISVTLRLRHLDQVGEGENGRRCGCEFVNLSASATRMLQRYLNRLDAERTRTPGQQAA
jgi:c-di-GMP-binding flagellar brake protein YcgR